MIEDKVLNSYYGILGVGVLIVAFCIFFAIRCWQTSRKDPWWGKLIAFSCGLVVIGGLGGLGIGSTYAVLNDTEYRGPQIQTPKVPQWYCNCKCSK